MHIHGTCVRWHDKGILFLGRSGSGKSTAALSLIEKGAVLVADDGVSIDIFDNHLTAVCPDTIFGKMEVRGVGLVSMNAVSKSSIDLVIQCEPDFHQVPRMPKEIFWEILGLKAPMYFLCPFENVFTSKVLLLLQKV